MLKLSLLSVTGAAAIALAASAPAPANAGFVHLTPALGSVASESNVVDVRRHSRRDRRSHRWDRRDRNAWIALGLGSAIVGGMLAAPRSPAYGHAASAWDLCAARFRSLRPDGTYTTYDGRRVLCPYLR